MSGVTGYWFKLALHALSSDSRNILPLTKVSFITPESQSSVVLAIKFLLSMPRFPMCPSEAISSLHSKPGGREASQKALFKAIQGDKTRTFLHNMAVVLRAVAC